MEELTPIKGIDIYLLDQFLKGNIHPDQRILDAGCGSGRNIHLLIEQNAEIVGIDPDESRIAQLQEKYPEKKGDFLCASIESYQDGKGFDAIICNAVLHFADSHDQFNQQFEKLVSLLKSEGILFIRMTSDIGVKEGFFTNEQGRSQLPDGSSRYLLTRAKVDELLAKFSLKLVEPVKTVNVDDQRCMTTLVLQLN